MIIPGDAYSIGTGGYFLNIPFPILTNLVITPTTPTERDRVTIDFTFEYAPDSALCRISNITKDITLIGATGSVTYGPQTLPTGTTTIEVWTIRNNSSTGYAYIDDSYSITLTTSGGFSLYNDAALMMKQVLESRFGTIFNVLTAGTSEQMSDDKKPYILISPMSVDTAMEPIGHRLRDAKGEAQDIPYMLTIYVRRGLIVDGLSETELIRKFLCDFYEFFRDVEEDIDAYITRDYVRKIYIGNSSDIIYMEEDEEFTMYIPISIQLNHERA